MKPNDSIFALSSGQLPSGVAIIRISGTDLLNTLKLENDNTKNYSLFDFTPEPRNSHLLRIYHPKTDELIDHGLVLYFPAPHSFTGEDCLELHVHGGKAVVAKLLDALSQIKDWRMAEAGEFSRRAFENGRLDLTEIEGLADLIASETETQRKLALNQSMGNLRKLYEGWRERLIHSRAMIEAELDFADEDDVPDTASDQIWSQLQLLNEEIDRHLGDERRGEILRDGFRVALIGAPNAGKSSLLNALAQRDVAIVTSEAGTTRDIVEVKLDISGVPIVISDTAGIRETQGIVEQEGIKRSFNAAKEADLVLLLDSKDAPLPEINLEISKNRQLLLHSKNDLEQSQDDVHISISSKTGSGLDLLIKEITDRVDQIAHFAEAPLITRARHRENLHKCIEALEQALETRELPIELIAENLRQAADAIGRITGRVDVEDLLDVIFSEFCVGK
jgi:tRNA modification GTPase